MFHKENSSLGGNKKAMDVALRKSDRKKLLKAAQEVLLAVVQGSSEKDAAMLYSVFMEGTLMVRKILHAQLNKVQLYFRSPSNATTDQLWPYTQSTQCVWMVVDLGPGMMGAQAPTVALWSVLSSPPENNKTVVTIPSQASKYLCRGAHLFRAGISSLPNDCGSRPDMIVAICVQGNPQPFAIGRLTKSTTTETIQGEAKGVGVEIWTCYGDDIWKQSCATNSDGNGAQCINPMGGVPYENGNYGNVGFLEGKMVHPITSLEDSDDNEENKESEQAMEGEQVTDSVANLSLATDADATDQQQQQDVAPSQDDILHSAVCKAIVNLSDKDLPMATANFYANHVLHHRDAQIELKQTRWKKFGTYLLEQASMDEPLLQVKKDGTNPAGFIVSVNRRHVDLRGLKKDKSATATSDKKKMSIVTLYMVPNHFVALLGLDPDECKAVDAKSEERRGTGMLTSPEVRAILNGYLETNQLLPNPSKVILDAALTDALYGKKNKQNAPDSLSRQDANTMWTCRMEPAHAVVEMPGSRITKLARGPPPKVTITVEKRQGNRKYVTRLRGMEEYGLVNGQHALCKDISRRFACAGAVETETDGRRAALKKDHVELVFQGHLAQELKALLIGDEHLSSHGGVKGSPYCLPKQVVEVDLKKGVPARRKR